MFFVEIWGTKRKEKKIPYNFSLGKITSCLFSKNFSSTFSMCMGTSFFGQCLPSSHHTHTLCFVAFFPPLIPHEHFPMPWSVHSVSMCSIMLPPSLMRVTWHWVLLGPMSGIEMTVLRAEAVATFWWLFLTPSLPELALGKTLRSCLDFCLLCCWIWEKGCRMMVDFSLLLSLARSSPSALDD